MEINGNENVPALHTCGNENVPATLSENKNGNENVPENEMIVARLQGEIIATLEAREGFRSRANECTRQIRALEKQLKRALRS